MWVTLGVLLFVVSVGTFIPCFFAVAADNYLAFLLPTVLFFGSVYCIWRGTWGRLR